MSNLKNSKRLETSTESSTEVREKKKYTCYPNNKDTSIKLSLSSFERERIKNYIQKFELIKMNRSDFIRMCLTEYFKSELGISKGDSLNSDKGKTKESSLEDSVFSVGESSKDDSVFSVEELNG